MGARVTPRFVHGCFAIADGTIWQDKLLWKAPI